MRIGSLFSGAGGLDLAVAQVFGGDIVWHAEIDKAASKVLAYRFPGVPNLGSVTDIDWAAVPPVDVLCGGFPCQDVSAAGKRAGIKAGTRSGLWSVFADAIGALRPQWVVIENVRGLLSATAHRTVEDDAGSDVEPVAGVVGDGAGRPVLRAAGAVLGDLADIGYDAQWATLAAADVGAPHRRERVFIVVHTSGAAVGESTGSAFAEETRQGSGDRSGNRGGERTVADGRQSCGCGDRRIDHDWFANPDRFDDGGCRRCRCEGFWPAADSTGYGWDEGKPESARIVGGFDAAVGGDEPGVALLPTPCVVDRLATTDMTLEQWDESRRSQKERGVGSFGPRGDSLGAAVLRVEEGTVDERPDYSTRGALLPTPTTQDGSNNAGPSQFERNSLPLNTVVTLLPTPQAHDSQGPKTPEQVATMRANGYGVRNLNETAVHELLSTPQSRDYKGRPSDGFNNANLCRDVALMPNPSAWGKYEPAIRRWEQLVGPAPAPTEPNKNGNPRLSAAFSEWLMGWPAGWVTDPAIGISRNDQLRIVGNGVCPQQAIAALRYLLSICEVTS